MGPQKTTDPCVLTRLEQKLLDPATSIPQKYRVLFALRNLPGEEPRSILAAALADRSALLRHEVAYCLGQRQDAASVDTLQRVLGDTAEHPMVRHEAGEALGAIGTEECLSTVRQYTDDPILEVAETCQLALQRIEHLRQCSGTAADPGESPYSSVDPTPAAPASTPTHALRQTLLDEGTPMFQRYQAMFALRNKGGTEAVEALGASFAARSALLKHEVAYVLGQMQDPEAVRVLSRVLKDERENAMVRHEAAEALGSIASADCLQLLKEHAADAEAIVAHSCEVALDMLAYELSGDFQYVDVGPAA